MGLTANYIYQEIRLVTLSWITALCWRRGLHNSMKLWAIPCRVTQDGQVIVKSSDTPWSTGGGNGNPVQYSSHENSIFPVVMYGRKSWTVKKAEYQGINAFELWCWRRFLRVPWTARSNHQSILKEINPWIFTGRTGAEAEAPVLWPHDEKSWLTGKDPDAGKDWRQKEKGVAEDEKVR